MGASRLTKGENAVQEEVIDRTVEEIEREELTVEELYDLYNVRRPEDF